MAHRITRTFTTILALTLLSANLVEAQANPPQYSWGADPKTNTFHEAALIGPSKGELYVVTIANPKHRQTCQIKSFNENQLVCSFSFGRKPVIYRAADVAALIIPGEHTNERAWFLGFAGTGAGAITGAVFLASITIVGAVAVAIVGGLILLISPLAATSEGDHPDNVLYLAPGQQLQVKLLAD